MKAFWFIIGCLSVGAGVIGIVLPLIPTVPFMILAAFCFARSSERLHNRLLEHPVFGPAITEWRDQGAISIKAKRIATVTICLMPLISWFLGVRPIILLIQSVVLGAVLAFILSRPTPRH